MTRGLSKLQSRHARRTGDDGTFVELDLHFRDPIEPTRGGRLLLESLEARERRIEGLLQVFDTKISRDRIRMIVGPVGDETKRLDFIARTAGPLELRMALCVAEYVVRQLCDILADMRGQDATTTFRPEHGALASHAVLIQPDGRLTLVGGGHRGLTELLIPPATSQTSGLASLAPEVLRAEPPNPRSDVYGLGAIAYELIAGLPYRQALTEHELRAAAFCDRPADLPAALHRSPSSLLGPLSKTLAPLVEERYESPDDFHRDLVRVLDAHHCERWSEERFAAFVVHAPPGPLPSGPRLLGPLEPEAQSNRPVSIVRRRAPSEAQPAQVVIRNATPVPARPEPAGVPVVRLGLIRTARERQASSVELDRRHDLTPLPNLDTFGTVEVPVIELARLRELSLDDLAPDTEESPVPDLAAAFAESLATSDLGPAHHPNDGTQDLPLPLPRPGGAPLPLILIGMALFLALGLAAFVILF